MTKKFTKHEITLLKNIYLCYNDEYVLTNEENKVLYKLMGNNNEM